MRTHAPRGVWVAVAIVSSAAAGCSSDRTPTAPTFSSNVAASVVAAHFNTMGDSVVAAHGDSDDANRFYGAAAVLQRAPVFDTITILVDNVPQTFNAVALAVDDTLGPAACPMPPMDNSHDAEYECPFGFPRVTHTLFAWQPGQPAHIIQLVAMSDSGVIGLPRFTRGDSASADSASHDSASVDSATRALLPIPARLKYFNGAGGTWWGTSGTQQNSVTPGTAPCPTPKDSTGADSSGRGEHHGFHVPPAACVMADFTFQFTGTVGVPGVSWQANNATGTHTVSLALAHVPGAYVALGRMVRGDH